MDTFERFCNKPTKKSESGLVEKNQRWLKYHLEGLKAMTNRDVDSYISSLDIQPSSKYALSNLMCKYLVHSKEMTAEQKKMIVSKYSISINIDEKLYDVKHIIARVNRISTFASRDVAIVYESALNMRRVKDIINLDYNNYMPKESVDIDLYTQAIEKYMQQRKYTNKKLYINDDGSVITNRQIFWLYYKLSKDMQISITADKIRNAFISKTIKDKGILFVSRILKYKKFETIERFL